MKLRGLTDYEYYRGQQNARSGGTTAQFSAEEITNLGILEVLDYHLDIGTRDGGVVHKLHQYGFSNSYGIDIGDNAEQTWQKYDDKVRSHLMRADIHDGIPFDFEYKLITASHVVEHLYDPAKAISIIRDKLVDDGYFYSKVPNVVRASDYDHTPHFAFFENLDDYETFVTSLGYKTIYKSFEERKSQEIILLVQKD